MIPNFPPNVTFLSSKLILSFCINEKTAQVIHPYNCYQWFYHYQFFTIDINLFNRVGFDPIYIDHVIRCTVLQYPYIWNQNILWYGIISFTWILMKSILPLVILIRLSLSLSKFERWSGLIKQYHIPINFVTVCNIHVQLMRLDYSISKLWLNNNFSMLYI